MPPDSQSTFPIVSELTPEPARSVSTNVNEPIDPDNPRWRLGGAFMVWVASLILLVLVPLFFVILYADFYYGLNFGSPRYLHLLRVVATTDRTAFVVQIFAIAPAHLLTFALVWALVTRFGQRPFMASLGLGWSGGRSLLVSVGLGVALFVAATGFIKLLGLDQTPIIEQIMSSRRARFLIAVPAILTAPLVEELVYRGVLYSALQRVVGVIAAVLVVVMLFMLIHLPQHWFDLRGLAIVGMLSIALTIMRAYTGRLLPCIVLHFVVNGITYTIFLIAPHLAKVGPSSEQVASAVLLLANLRLSMFGL